MHGATAANACALLVSSATSSVYSTAHKVSMSPRCPWNKSAPSIVIGGPLLPCLLRMSVLMPTLRLIGLAIMHRPTVNHGKIRHDGTRVQCGRRHRTLVQPTLLVSYAIANLIRSTTTTSCREEKGSLDSKQLSAVFTSVHAQLGSICFTARESCLAQTAMPGVSTWLAATNRSLMNGRR